MYTHLHNKTECKISRKNYEVVETQVHWSMMSDSTEVLSKQQYVLEYQGSGGQKVSSYK